MRRPRRGLTLLELCVSVALLGLVGAVVTSAWLYAGRAMGGTSDALHARATVRVAAAALAAELRHASPEDVYTVAESALDLLRPIGAAVVCAVDGVELVLPPAGGAADPALTRWSDPPRPGDVVRVRRADPAGSWAAASLARLAEHRTATHCPASSGYAAATDATLPRPGLVLAALPAGVRAGAAVWIGRRLRYALYRGGDGSWQLGRRECDGPPPAPCDGVQPVAGPLLPFHREPARSGLHAALLDGVGRPVAPGDPAARALRITLRAPRGAGQPDAATESVTVLLALRNRS